MDENQKIADEIERERQRRELEKSKPKRISRSQVKEARFVWMAGTVTIDILTAWLIWNITTYWYYALVWVAAGAGGLLYSERLKERVGNNSEQKEIGETGVKVSAVAVFGMALTVGTFWVLRLENLWLNAFMEITALVLFFFHLYQSYQYHQKDDLVAAENDEARSEEENARQIHEAHRAARLVESKKIKTGVEHVYRQQHGAAFDAAYQSDTVRPELKDKANPQKPER